MSRKNDINSLEQNKDWKAAVDFLEHEDGSEPELYLRVMFLLLDLLVEGQYTPEEHDFASMKLKQLFAEARSKFSTNCEFLFFAGIMIYVAEWYFGIDSVNHAAAMLEKAMRTEPNNILYQWGYYSTIDQRPEKNTDLKLQLSERLLSDKYMYFGFLRSKGLLGQYVLGVLEGSYQKLKTIKQAESNC